MTQYTGLNIYKPFPVSAVHTPPGQSTEEVTPGLWRFQCQFRTETKQEVLQHSYWSKIKVKVKSVFQLSGKKKGIVLV